MIWNDMGTGTTEKQTLGFNIRRLCKQQEISLRQLAKDLDMNRPYLYEILSGEANPSFDLLTRIANYLDGTVQDLLAEPKKKRSA